MSFQEFVDLVKLMRQHQKKYFRSRSASDLSECKDLERRVDRAIEEINQPLNLFDDGNKP